MKHREKQYGIGQEKEQELAKHFEKKGWLTIPISEYIMNTGSDIVAPMLGSNTGPLISPDLCITKEGKVIWIEVKAKTEPTYTYKKHRWEHGIDKPNFEDYQHVSKMTGFPCYIFVHENKSPKTPDLYLDIKDASNYYSKIYNDLQLSNTWLSILLDDAFHYGEYRPNNPKMKRKNNPEGIGFYWPRDRMKIEII